MSNDKSMNTQERIALAASGAILLAVVVYWTTQIVGVMAMLELAYG